MGDDKGFDDQFNDGLFRATLNVSKLTRPDAWPKSVSEMRSYTQYSGNQGMPHNHDIGHSSFILSRPNMFKK